MPWNSNNNQGGGPWKPSNGPWGQGPGGNNGGGQTPPDLEELLRRGQDKLRQVLPSGGIGATNAWPISRNTSFRAVPNFNRSIRGASNPVASECRSAAW